MTMPNLVPQSYGIAMAQVTFGGPRGVWLECTSCDASHRIAASGWTGKSDAEVAAVFRHHGWTGRGDSMKRAKCPKCATPTRNGQGVAE